MTWTVDDSGLGLRTSKVVGSLRASRNRFYAQLTGFTAAALRFSIQTTNRYKGVQLASIADHKKVADAILIFHAFAKKKQKTPDRGNRAWAGSASRRCCDEKENKGSRGAYRW